MVFVKVIVLENISGVFTLGNDNDAGRIHVSLNTSLLEQAN